MLDGSIFDNFANYLDVNYYLIIHDSKINLNILEESKNRLLKTTFCFEFSESLNQR